MGHWEFHNMRGVSKMMAHACVYYSIRRQRALQRHPLVSTRRVCKGQKAPISQH